MATRNRTILFRRYRDALKSVRVPAGSSPSSSGGRAVIELSTASLLNPNRSYTPLSTEDPGTSRGTVAVGLPPAWVDVSEEIATNIQRVRGKMAELSKAHAKALMPSFGDGKEDQRQIEALTQEITDLLKKSEKRLQRLSTGGPSEDSNIRKNVQRSLATDLQTLSMELRKKQSTYLKRLRQQKEGSDGVDLEMNLNGSKSTRDDDDDMDDIGFSEHQMARLKKSEAFTAEREREIQQVVESVNELAQIMKDLSVLVIDQGTIVDRIDYNITNVAASVEDGLKQLQKAERSQKQGGMVMCATILIIMCFVMLVLLVLKEIIF
ncbi:syntaxin-43-like isoform X2 [Salvia miltiorrhiza]|uniref:syntaxin-43-like isoform X2 n=1 Tax=Salvia miltiorrhiza TaxID=226208 RepID=UPI0025AC8BF3|nr:syntaxin-43-like isoform X2 [Salvia miltiorrhiza]